jgi:hypothetical protein
MLGLTVVADVVVLLLYALTGSIALSSCSGNGFDAADLGITLGSLVLAIGELECVGAGGRGRGGGRATENKWGNINEYEYVILVYVQLNTSHRQHN